ncbi:hypothetical protein C6P46_005356 [Rhodotorula mucilaginosa]|uniref:UDP-glucose:glycoprotein glucosyltransferase n=1 Tax=Rhodotorula mucilaginosa TaxID=5537 RepID=A0A9P6VYX3_RHOMI|nr:hypothetical protein C6P46_005356 [Rhodotorula mucilaginosa]
MRIRRVVATLSLASAGLVVHAYTSPPVFTSIEASWPAPDLVTQYLETLALEAPNEFFPSLDFLVSHPHSHLFWPTSEPPLRPAALATAQSYADRGINPIFASQSPDAPDRLWANETIALLEASLAQIPNLANERGLLESLRVAVANREASVRIEGIRRMWEDRVAEMEVGASSTVEADDEAADSTTSAQPWRSCESWIDVGGKAACSVDEFWSFVGEEQRDETLPILLPSDLPLPNRTVYYAVDHVSPAGANDHLDRVVLYGSPVSPAFPELFHFLYHLSITKIAPHVNPKTGQTRSGPPRPPRIQFALRWKPSSRAQMTREKLVLGGYGAMLDVKKSDYLAIDDRVTGSTAAAEAGVGKAEPSEPILEIEGDAPPKMEPVKKADIAELSVRTAQFIHSAQDPFSAFVDLTSAFPRLASHLPVLVPDPSPHLISEVSTNQMTSPLARRPAFFLNGKHLTEDEVEPFALLRIMRKERKIINDLLGLEAQMTGADARHILIAGGPKEPTPSQDRIDPELLGELYDATDQQEGEGVILWWNDLEKDRRYKSWTKSVRELLRPSYPGSMAQVARNLNNLVFILDLSRSDSLQHITRNIKQYVSRGLPIRFGVVPHVGPSGDSSSVSTLMAQMTWHLTDAAGRTATMAFLDRIAQALPSGGRISEDLVKRAYSQLRTSSTDLDGEPLAPLEQVRQYGIGAKGRGSHSRLSKTRSYLERLALPQEAKGSVFLNGAHFPLDEDFTQNLQRTLGLHTQFLSQEVYMRSLTDDTDASTYFADLPQTHKRRNPFIFPSDESNPLKIVNLVEALKGVTPSWLEHGFISAPSHSADEAGHDVEPPPPIASLIVVTDLDSRDGIDLARHALLLADTDARVRVSFLHNPATAPATTHAWSLSRVFWKLVETGATEELLPRELGEWIDLGLTQAGPREQDGQAWPEENPLRQYLANGLPGRDGAEAELYWALLAFIRVRFGFAAGESGLVLNGRVIGPFRPTQFPTPDLQTLLTLELEKRILPVVAAVNATSLDSTAHDAHDLSQFYMLATSVVGAAHIADPAAGLFATSSTERRRDYLRLHASHTPQNPAALYEIAVVIDPATELAQRWAPIIRTLNELNSTIVSLYLNPSLHLTEVPIKRFYEFCFASKLTFSPSGAELQPQVRFDAIPPDVLVTYATDLQRAWLAFPRTGIHDLDNIKLGDLPLDSRERGVEAVLELETLIVEGHARDMPSSRPPRGLQLELSRPGSLNAAADRTASIVMANLGYVQLKANPGLWRLDIRSGRSADVFELESIGADGWKSAEVAKTGNEFFVSTLEGKTIYPRFRRRPGHETTELLDESAAEAVKDKTATLGIWNRVKSMLPFVAPSSTDLVDTGKRADINVFTVASGHLYERMAFLMIVSVLRHTKSSVKFWFIQNFLSPSFKAFIPHMAKEYGFDYELVTYKWPHWLRGQKEKQREIWGYKILFLDVLFPLELDRVIFVDSDQIVRADLKELVDLDLKGAPYAYAPMGGYDGEKPEMEGFRFWKTGYWARHLQGRPYHISALYVVDLDRFRQIAAGDLLRQQYQALSADPGSLSNLDQDLPNNMTPNLPIYTLPKEWLWCETWCSDEDLATAKTIDLCNNPLTHEPKLQRAKRLIPEWTEYDDEVASLAKRVATAQGESVAFEARADEMEQALQQQQERDDFVGSSQVEPPPAEHVKDEL